VLACHLYPPQPQALSDGLYFDRNISEMDRGSDVDSRAEVPQVLLDVATLSHPEVSYRRAGHLLFRFPMPVDRLKIRWQATMA
jgi:hypothetical protein